MRQKAELIVFFHVAAYAECGRSGSFVGPVQKRKDIGLRAKHATTPTLMVAAALAGLMLWAAPTPGWAQPTYTVIQHFTGVDGGGQPTQLVGRESTPNDPASWVLYGTTHTGGGSKAANCLDGCGVAFKLTPPPVGTGPWTETRLYVFQGHGDGGYPNQGVVFDAAGALYGATTVSSTTGTFGTLYRLTPPGPGAYFWSETTLHSFYGTPDIYIPSSVTLDAKGDIFVTSTGGGYGGEGAVEMFTPPAAGQTKWQEHSLYSFSESSNSLGDTGGLLLTSSGTLYGTLPDAGASGLGSPPGLAYSLSPPPAGQSAWTYTSIFGFGPGVSGHGGSLPNGPLIADPNGALYGTTVYGGTYGYGTVFRLNPPGSGSTAWTETILYNFAGTDDGLLPLASLLRDSTGALYGTATGGGTKGNGVVFKLIPRGPGQSTWTETVLHSFQGGIYDGKQPETALTMDPSGALYGVTIAGGRYGQGIAFKITQ